MNQIVCELPPEHPVSTVRPLRDSLGHTPLQVCLEYYIQFVALFPRIIVICYFIISYPYDEDPMNFLCMLFSVLH